MKIDLHVHSIHSKRPSHWLLKKIGCRESYTEPSVVYKTALNRGMDMVTITDHNKIDGCMEIACLPGVFISEEVTAYFPEDKCKVHVLVYNITEAQHEDIQRFRENIYDLVLYLNEKKVFNSLAHPFYSVQDKYDISHFEKLMLLFNTIELNGDQPHEANRFLKLLVKKIQRKDIERIADKYDITPIPTNPWEKTFTAGSDDHSCLNIGKSFTEVENARNVSEYFSGISKNKGKETIFTSNPLIMARNVYSIAYQFSKTKFNLGRKNYDVLLKFLDNFLITEQKRDSGSEKKVSFIFNDDENNKKDEIPYLVKVLIGKTEESLSEDSELANIVENDDFSSRCEELMWFKQINKISNKVLHHFSEHLFEGLFNADLPDLFRSASSVGALYTLLSPYFIAFSQHSRDRRFGRKVVDHVSGRVRRDAVKVAHFTDTFFEINGVALTLNQQLAAAQRSGKDYTIITCGSDEKDLTGNLITFDPINVHELAEYPEQKIFIPPVLEMLNHCYWAGYNRIHSATPGPIGLAALVIARLLKLPLIGTYHTQVPQFARYLTDDHLVESLMWKYVVWYYNQMDVVYSPSQSTSKELMENGVKPEKIKIFPRGIDVQRFHPGNGGNYLKEKFNVHESKKLLYTGRISKEKNLPMLCNAFKNLIRDTLDVRLIVVGDGPYFNEMRQELKWTPTTFTGYLTGKELAEAYSSCDLFVFPSTTDTFGNVVLEAQASGLPAIISDMGGPKENIIPDKTGLVIADIDEKKLADTIRKVLSQPQMLKKMGKNAREYMEKRSFEYAFNKTWEMYSTPNTAKTEKKYAKAM